MSFTELTLASCPTLIECLSVGRMWSFGKPVIEVAPWTNQGLQGINWLWFMDPDMVHGSHSIKNKYINKTIEIEIEMRERERLNILGIPQQLSTLR